MALAEDSFAARFALALNALNFSRGQLSASAGLDKSLVSRWLSGQAVPTSHNLARLSEAIAQRKPGFNMTFWNIPRADFEAFFGVPRPASMVPPEQPPAPDVSSAAGSAETRPDAELNSLAGYVRWAAAAAGAILILVSVAWLWASERGGFSGARSRPLPAPAGITTARAGSIAVLPLANISGDARKKYFSDGLTEELIATLAKVPGLRVAARSSSFAFAGKPADIRTIAKALNVRSILEGSVRQDGDRVRIEIELVNASDGFQQWSRSYDRDLKNILQIQSDIAHSVAQVLSPGPARTPAAAAKVGEIDPSIYRNYLQAQVSFSSRTVPGTERAIALLRDVTRAAPNFADGFAARASALSDDVVMKLADTSTVREFQSSLDRALSLDPTNPQALAVRIEYEASRLNWDAVIADALTLRRLYPHNATALQGLFSAYRTLGLYDLAVSAESEAARLDPLSYIARRKLGGVLVDLGRFKEAIAAIKQSLEIQPGQPSAMSELCFAEASVHRLDQARSILLQLSLPGMPTMTETYCAMGIALSTGDIAKARAIAEDIAAHYRIPGAKEDDLAKVFAVAGEYNRAMDWFERAYDHQVFFFDIDSDVTIPKALFQNPRWIALTRRPAFQQWRIASTRARRLFTTH